MHLKFDYHVANMVSKIFCFVVIMSKLGHFLPKTILIEFYYSLIQSHFLYGILAWGPNLQNINQLTPNITKQSTENN